MDVALLARICEKISERQNREQALAQWTALQPWMAAKIVKELTWQDFWARVENSKVDTRPTSEILADVEAARKELQDGSI